eukprot:Rmarinus@m.7386
MSLSKVLRRLPGKAVCLRKTSGAASWCPSSSRHPRWVPRIRGARSIEGRPTSMAQNLGIAANAGGVIPWTPGSQSPSKMSWILCWVTTSGGARCTTASTPRLASLDLATSRYPTT